MCDQVSDEVSQSTLSTFRLFYDSITKTEEVVSDPFEDQDEITVELNKGSFLDNSIAHDIDVTF